MSGDLINNDVEGDMQVVETNRGSQLMKVLPLEVAWHIGSFFELEDNLEHLVDSISENREMNRLEILYKPDIKPFNLQSLLTYIRPALPFGAWRLSIVMLKIAECLHEFHQAGIPQMVIHPQRVGKKGAEITLIPTLAKVLPPFSEIGLTWQDDWVFFMAPEVIRKRGSSFEDLFSGDIYSFGKFFQVLIMPEIIASSESGILKSLEDLVEYKQKDNYFQTIPPSLTVFSTLIEGLCAFFPENRLSLENAILELRNIVNRLDPVQEVENLISTGELEEARSLLSQLENEKEKLFSPATPETILLLKAQSILVSPTPDFPEAINLFHHVLKTRPDSDIYYKLGQAYLKYKSHKQHLLLAAEAFANAGRLSGWNKDIMQIWLEVVSQFEDANDRLVYIQRIPISERPKGTEILRINALVDKGEIFQAWNTIAAFLGQVIFDQAAYELAIEISKQIDPTVLLSWKYQIPEIEKNEAIMSVIWARNGNISLAALHLDRAKQKSDQS